MKSIYITFTLLILTLLSVSAQNDVNLYDSWKSGNQKISWQFSDRADDEVDRGAVSYHMIHNINTSCDCKSVTSIPFDWKSKNGKINLYYNINSSSSKIDIISKPGTSADRIASAKEICRKVSDESLTEFKRNLRPDVELNYNFSGNTLILDGASYNSTSGASKQPQKPKVEQKN